MKSRNRISDRGDRDGGFTLIELLMTIVIMGVITVPLGNFVISYFVNTATTTGRLSESHDEQIAAAYFSQDVAGVGTRDATQNPTQSVWDGSFTAPCGTVIAAANQSLLLKWDDPTWNAATETNVIDAAAYFKVVTPSETQLHRRVCIGATQQSDIVVIHNLDPGITPAVSCSTTCTGTNPVPKTITLQIGLKASSGSGQPFTTSLTGQRRQS